MAEAWFLFAGLALCLFGLFGTSQRDWVRLRSISRQAEAEVINHHILRDSDGPSYAPIWRFSAEGQSHAVIDQVYRSVRQPPLGARRTLVYPVGRPDLARIPRPAMWLVIYLFLIGLTAVLIARLVGWLPPPNH